MVHAPSTQGYPQAPLPTYGELETDQPASELSLAGHDDHHDTDEDGDEEEIEDDDSEDGAAPVDILACLDRGPGSPPHCPQFTWKSPLEGLTEDEISRKVKQDLGAVGPISLGAPNRGRLFNGVQMPKDERWKFSDPGHAWGTQETIDSIKRAVDKVHQKHKDTQPLYIGHISAKGGGYLKPHKSHQAGRDVDLSYFYTTATGWYAVATDKNLDKPRTWTFVKAFLEDPNTEMILIDSPIQRLLFDYALSIGEDKAFLERVFQVAGKSQRPIIRHVRGHSTHIHVRFFSPSAQLSGRLASAHLPKPAPPPERKRSKGKHVAGKADGHRDTDGGSERLGKKAKSHEPNARKASSDEDAFVYHRARSGDTLDSLARKYGVSIQSIKQANGLKSNELKQKKTYRIPRPEGSTASASPAKSAQTGGRKR